MNDLIPANVNGDIIHQREADGYFNATGMCKAAGKNWNHYWTNAATKAFIDELSSDTGIPVSELIQILKGGKADLQGTWIHPLVATHLAQWLSPKFAVAVTKLVTAWSAIHRRIALPELDEEDLLRHTAESMVRAADRISVLKSAVVAEREKAQKTLAKNEELSDRASAAEEAVQILLKKFKAGADANYAHMKQAQAQIEAISKNLFSKQEASAENVTRLSPPKRS